MKLTILKRPNDDWSRRLKNQHGYASEVFGDKLIKPLAITTTQLPPFSYLLTSDKYGSNLVYFSSELFNVVDPHISSDWVLMHYKENIWGSRITGPMLFIGLPGLEDEKFIERVMDRESEADLVLFRQIVENKI